MLLTPEDIDAGYKEVALEYQRGPAREGWPTTVRLNAPSRRQAKQLAARLQRDQSDEPFWPILEACLPRELANEEFIGRLTFECEGLLSATAIGLTFGPADQKKILAAVEAAIHSATSAPNSPSSDPGSEPARK